MGRFDTRSMSNIKKEQLRKRIGSGAILRDSAGSNEREIVPGGEDEEKAPYRAQRVDQPEKTR